MTWFADEAICDYFPIAGNSSLRAIGWLEAGHSYRNGTIRREVYSRLVELLKDPWEPVACAGPHDCSLCAFEPEAKGAKNLFVPGKGFLYVCPELIAHYINAHGYAPSEEFCEAVLRCCDTRSMAYKRLFLANGGRALMMALRQQTASDGWSAGPRK